MALAPITDEEIAEWEDEARWEITPSDVYRMVMRIRADAAEIEKRDAALTKINAIRNDIVGRQYYYCGPCDDALADARWRERLGANLTAAGLAAMVTRLVIGSTPAPKKIDTAHVDFSCTRIKRAVDWVNRRRGRHPGDVDRT